MPFDRLVDRPGLDPAQTHMRTGERGYGPRKAPAVAMEHRQRPQIDRVLRHPPHQDVAERVQVGAAMVIDDPFRVAGGARGVVERDRVPLVLGGDLGEIGVTLGEEGFVIERAKALPARTLRVGDVDDQRLLVEEGERAADRRREFGVGDQHHGFAVAEDEGDRLGIEADVERVQHRAGHRDAEMRLEGLGHVGRHQRHRVAAPDTARRQRRGEAAAAFEALPPGMAALAMDDRGVLGVDRRRAQQKPDRRQGDKIGPVLAEAGLVRVGCLIHRRSAVMR